MSSLFVRSIKSLIICLPILVNAYGQTFVQFGDSAGLPYPDSSVNVSLKEADVKISTESQWAREVEGFEPHHTVLMNIEARYVIVNDMNELIDLPLRIPLPVSLNKESLEFKVNSVIKNYTSVEYDNPREKGTGLHLYTLNMNMDANSENVLEVSADSSGVGSIEEDFTFILTNATKWPKIGKISIFSENENSLITGYSIQPSETTLKMGLWEFDSTPDKDLTIRWKVLTSPVSPQIPSSEIEASPLIPPIIALIIGGLIVGAIAYIRVKRKRESINQ